MPLKTKTIFLNSFIGEAPKTINSNFESVSNYFDLFYDSSSGTLTSTTLNSTTLNSTNANINSISVDYLTVKRNLSYENFIDPNDHWETLDIATIDASSNSYEVITTLNVSDYIDSFVINNKNTDAVSIIININNQEVLSKTLNPNTTYNIVNFEDYYISNVDSNNNPIVSVPMVITLNGSNLTNGVSLNINIKKVVNN